MPTFSYQAVDKSGKLTKGTMTAPDKGKVEAALRAKNLVPTKVNAQTALQKDIQFNIGPKVKPKEMAVFCRQMVSLLKAGVTIIESLTMLAEQTESKNLASALGDTKDEIQKGETLANAMKKQSDVFPPLMVNMVEAGESSGSLEIVFERLGIQLEKSAKLKATVKKAMVYPIIVLIVAVVVVIVILLFVIPNFMSMFDDMEMEMPALTVAVINASEFMQKRWYIIAAVVAGIVMGVKLFAKTSYGESLFATLAIKTPAIKTLVIKTACANLARTLSTLLSSGMSIIEALEITGKTLSNLHYKNAVLFARDEVSKGTTLAQPISKTGLFPPMICHMIKIGEETGNLEDMLMKTADYYEEEVEDATKALMTAMEPMIIIVLALLVGILVGAVMMPMMTMYEGLDNL